MAGEELLIVDPSDRDREGLRKYFDGRGFVCTAVRSGAEARERLSSKFFPAALIDLDVDGQGHGLDLVRFVRERSRETAVVLLTSRRSFEGAVGAVRLGVVDVALKVPEQVEVMRQSVEQAAARYRAKDGSSELWREVGTVLDDSFKLLIEQARRVYADLSLAAPPLRPRVLFVDGDGDFMNALAPLVQSQKWDILADMSGGGALDRASRERIDILAVRGELPDLRGSMVLKSIQADHGEVMGLLYTGQGAEGRIEVYVRGSVEHVFRPFATPEHLVEAVKRVTLELATRAQERRIIQAFRNDHIEYVRRFAAVKKQIDALLGG